MELFILLGAMALSFLAGWTERGQALKPGECVRLEQGETFTTGRATIKAARGDLEIRRP